MSSFRRIRDFKPPTDATSAEELRRQLVQFETNVGTMADTIAAVAMPKLAVTARDVRSDKPSIGPGQSVSIARTVANVQLTAPQPGDAGKFLAICKGAGAASNTNVRAPAGSLINGSTTYLITTSGMMLLLYCDGVDFWAVQ